MDKIYKVDFVVNNAKNCEKIDVFLKVGNYQAQHTRLPFFYSDKYYVLFQPMESGLGDISFKTVSDDNNCQVTKVVVNKGR